MSLLTRVRLLVGTLVALLLLTAVSAIGLTQRTEAAADHLINSIRPAQVSLNALTRAYTDQANSVSGYILTGHPSFLQADTAEQSDAVRLRARLSQQLADDPAAGPLLARVDDAARAWRGQFVTPEVNAVRSGLKPPSGVPNPPGEQAFATLRARLIDLDSHVNRVAAHEVSQAALLRGLVQWLTLAGSLLAVAVAVSAIFFLRRSVTRPLRTLVAEVAEVADGELDHEVQPTGPVELAAVASAVDRMRVHILAQTSETMRAQQRLARYDESERIANGLHDQVIQRLVGTGMMLQSKASRDPALARQVATTITDIDRAIQELRTVVFGLTADQGPDAGLRQRLLDVLHDSERSLGFPLEVRFQGVIDPLVSDTVAEELIPTVRESLSNVVRHAQATRAEVSLTATDEELVLRVTDDGIGLPPGNDGGGRGLTNLHHRAERLGGCCTLLSSPSRGTTVDWRVPLRT